MLVSAKEMLNKAKAGHYAVGQFNINNLEWTKAILQTAQELNSPVIIGTAEILLPYGELSLIAPAMVAAAERASVPVVVHYDHGLTFERTMEALKRAGKTNEAAVLQAKSNQLNVEGSMVSLEQQIIEMENSLSSLLGVVPMTIRRGHLNEQNFPLELSQGLPAQLLAKRPDVKQAELALAQAYYATNMARASFYPKISLSGVLGWTASGKSVNPGDFIADLGASLLQPIFNKRALKANLKKAQAQQEAALYEFKQSLLDAGIEVNNALIQWQTAQKSLNIDQKKVVHLQAAVWNTQLLIEQDLL